MPTQEEVMDQLSQAGASANELLNYFQNKKNDIDSSVEEMKSEIKQHINSSKEMHTRIVITKNQQLDYDIDNGFPVDFSIHEGVTPSPYMTVSGSNVKGDAATALLQEMGEDMEADLAPTSHYRRNFNIFKLSWSGSPGWLAYPRCSDAAEISSIPLNSAITVGAFVKVLSGSVKYSWANGNELGKWVFCRQQLAGSKFGGYSHLHPIPISESGELLVALPAAITGFIDNPSHWFQNIQLG